MAPEGITVTEIRLGLPNTHYYLDWEPAAPQGDPAARRALLKTVRETCRALDWRVFAAGTGAGRARLVFRTSADNLESGLAALLQSARDYHLHVVQPETALPFIARCVHEEKDTDPGVRGAPCAGGPPQLPDVHYGLFMGERRWADGMLDLLTRCALNAAALPHRSRSLAELAGSHASSRDAIADAYRSGRFSLKDIAEYFDMHFSEVSAVINTASRQQRGLDTT